MELCSIASGSSGNCICVGTEESHLLVDAGISGKRIETGLNSVGLKTSEMEAILITHEHIDHIAGLGVLARRYGLPIYGTQGTLDAVRSVKSVGKIDESLLHPILPGQEFQVGDMTVHPISISHDAADPVAYLLQTDSRKIGVITDLGTYDDALVEKLQGMDILLLEANHDVRMLQTGSYPYPLKQRILSDRGHLSNVLSGQLLGRLLHDRFRAVVLGHLSKENNYAELAYETVRLEVSMGENPYKGDDFPIYVAKRSEVSQMICA
ncbi:MAG: MBL fold metallo-hydrolase [Eubacterium sp.]|nr:MBL fold metallo-hydrolase [Eubacterium sp.]